MAERYPATAYDKNLNDWEVTDRPVSQMDVASELLNALEHGLALRGGPLRRQLPDGSDGGEDGTVISIAWGSTEYDDGSRTVLGWYECGRG